MNWLWLLPAAGFAVLAAFMGVRNLRLKKQIRELTEYITKVQDFDSLPDIGGIAEGDIGILQSEIYKVVTLLREDYSSERKQKKYISDMMADISHQFKTPLTAISLMTELLMNPEVTQEQRLDYASKIDAQTGRMTWLIKNLLTLSQLEAGVLEMKMEEFPLHEMIAEIMESLEVMAEFAQVEVSAQVPKEIRIRADRHWMRETLTNIIKNGIEHTTAGGSVKVSANQNNLGTGIQIADTGKGIGREHLPHIFERFYKAGNESPGSVGIGLAMAKQIIHNHGGRIEVESREGEGTVFLIRL